VIIGLAHPAIVVTDLDKARDFYEKMFGFEFVMEETWDEQNEMYNQAVGLTGSSARGCILRGHNCFLELWQYSSPRGYGPDPAELGANEPGFRHLCFYSDDVLGDFERLKKLGGIVMNDPVGNDEWGYAVYCRDPFGNIIELSSEGGTGQHFTDLPGVVTPTTNRPN
jgi:catechol 2,3-dioxygenase-like lactoylglutathione lyase family enzyme